jgi:formate/nitrite transporter FocA (FNT family)
MQLKPLQKMTWAEVLSFWLMATCSGVMIGIGGVSSLLAVERLGEFGRLVGAVLFSLGIFTIVAYEMKLFTGMVASIPRMGVKNYWQLLLCFLGNASGVAIIALLAYATSAGETIMAKSQDLILAKLNAKNWGLQALCSSILCGILITISVRCRHYTKEKGISATLGVIFPIIVFAYCGFDHSVANMLHFFYLGEFSWRVVGYIAVSIAGNIIGGVIFPCITAFRKYAERKRAEQAQEQPSYIDD